MGIERDVLALTLREGKAQAGWAEERCGGNRRGYLVRTRGEDEEEAEKAEGTSPSKEMLKPSSQAASKETSEPPKKTWRPSNNTFSPLTEKEAKREYKENLAQAKAISLKETSDPSTNIGHLDDLSKAVSISLEETWTPEIEIHRFMREWEGELEGRDGGGKKTTTGETGEESLELDKGSETSDEDKGPDEGPESEPGPEMETKSEEESDEDSN